ncbi:MAG: hypothetical protein WAM60_06305 [Candidatus Promineifilaceae bacterium]
MDNLKIIQQRWRWQQQQKQHRLAQGRLTAEEAAFQLSAKGHIPLAAIPGHKDRPDIAIPTDAGGHLLLVAPPDSGWRDQLAMTLYHWPAAALVVDPGGRLYQQTGYFRETVWGKVYTVPGYAFNLVHYYRFWDSEPARRLHHFLVKTSPPEAEDWLLDHSAVLVEAIGYYGYHYKRNPLHLLLDAARTDLFQVLEALNTVDELDYLVTWFSMDLPPWEAFYDEDVRHSFALFRHQMARYQHLYGSFFIDNTINTIPKTWVEEKGSLYLTFSPAEMADLSGLAAAIVDGIHRYHLTHGGYEPLLLIIDAAFARVLPPIEQLLVEAAEYNITVILTADSLSALNNLAESGDGAALAGRFAHQVWYPPHDPQTAAHMAWLYGTELWEAGKPPRQLLSPEEPMAWPRDRVLVYTRRERPYRFLAERVTIPADLTIRPAPVPPKSPSLPRRPDSWLPLHVLAMLLPPRQKGPKMQKFLLEVVQSHKDDEDSAAEERSPSDQLEKNKTPHTADGDDIQPSLPLFSPIEDDQPDASSEEPEPPSQPRKTRLR